MKQRVDRPWNEYPIGTKAHSCTGGYWTRVERGWRWGSRGGTFPTPGGDACGACIELPEEEWHAGIMPDDALPRDCLVGRILNPLTDETGSGDVILVAQPEPLPLWRVMERAFAEWDWQGGDPEHAGPGFAAEIEALRDWLLPEEPEPDGRSEAAWVVWRREQVLRALLTAQARIAREGQQS